MTTRIEHEPLPLLIRSTTPDRSGDPPTSGGLSTATPPGALARWVRDVLAETVPALAGELAGGRAEVQVLRNGPKRLAVVQTSGRAGVVLKQYADDRGAWTRRWLQRLTEAGLTPPARFAVTPPRGWSRTRRTLVADRAAGRSWTDWLRAPAADRDAAAVAAAGWLTTLQSLPVDLPDRTGYRADESLRRESGALAVEHPEHAARLFRVADAAHGVLYGNPNAPAPDPVASHGDLHPENLHLSADGAWAVTAIDLDTAGLRRPAYDVGYALAQLLVQSWMRTGSFSAGADAGLVFWRQWTAGDGRDAEAVPAEVARALVQSLHFELITYRTGRTALLDHWLGIAGAVLADGVSAALSALASLPTEQEPLP